MHDVTAAVAAKLRESGVTERTVTVFVPGSTGAVTTIEYGPGVVVQILGE